MRKLAVLRSATPTDLDDINIVVGAAVMTWGLPERVKRLSLPSYQYSEHDFEHLEIVVAEVPVSGIVGVAAWEPADPHEGPAGQRALLLHGIYVTPEQQGGGIGTRLIGAAVAAAREQEFDGLLVRAQAGASGFFDALGFEHLPVSEPKRDYPHRYWRSVADYCDIPD